MKITFLNANFGIEFKIPENFIKTLNETIGKNKNIAIYCAIQFLEKIEEVKQLLEREGYRVITSKPDRANYKSQILGCDSYCENLHIDINAIDGFIYIGDGYFHPNALLLAQEFEEKIKPVIILNPVQELVEIIDKDHIEKYLKKKRGNMLKFHTSDVIGVFVSSKWGQEYKESALKLKEQYKDKEFYYFVSDNFSDNEMENFPFIQCWVNTACPRIGQDDILRHPKAVVNIKDIWKTSFK